MAPSPNSSFEDALKRARDFLQAKESKQREMEKSSSFSGMASPLRDNPEVGEDIRTPEEYKRRLQQRRLSDIILSSPPGTIQWPSQRQSFCEEPSSVNETFESTSQLEKSTFTAESAEEKLRVEAAKMRVAEEREIFELYDEADRQAREEQQKFLKRYTDLQLALEAHYRRDEEQILLEITKRKQMLIDRAKRDREMLLQLHKTLSEKSAESEKASAARSREILEMAEKVKQEEQKRLQQKQLELFKENNRKKSAEVVTTIEKSIDTLQKDIPESQSIKEQLIKVKLSLLDPANLTKASFVKEAIADVKGILDKYAGAVDEWEKKKSAEIKAQVKQTSKANHYVQAVERLKRNAEMYSTFIDNNKALRGNIIRFVQLTVNKIQKQTDNMQHALAFVKLFSKDTVRVGIGNEMVSLAGHSDGVSYAMDLTAKKILDNVEKLPSDPIQEWLPHVTVIATLWSMSPTFGDLFYDNLVSRCPFLIPLYFEDLTEEESLAYVVEFVHYKSETWSGFIRRMGYYARLLGVVCTMKPRWGPPFPPGKMWTLLAATLKCELKTKELCEVSAIVMKSLLETSGHTMKAAYRQQFTKYIHVLCTEYFEKLRSVAKNAPTVVSLEIFMKEILAAGGNFPPIS